MIYLGSIGIGAVWGWLFAKAAIRTVRPMRLAGAFALATALLASMVFFYTNWQALAFFLGTVFLVFLLHLGWLRSLWEHFGPPNSEEVIYE